MIASVLLPAQIGCAPRRASPKHEFVTGLVVASKAGVFVVHGFLPASPAERSGLVEGDLIVAVQGAETSTSDLPTVLRRLRGTTADPVSIVVHRDGREIGFLVGRESLRAILDRSDLRASGGGFLPQEEEPRLAPGDPVRLPAGRDLLTGEDLGFEFGESQVLVYFWASWCGACRNEIPLAFPIDRPGLHTIGISLDDSEEAARTFLTSQGFGDSQVFGGGWFGEWSRRFRVYRHGIPWTVLMDTDGTLVSQGRLPDTLASIPDSPDP